MTKQLVTAVGLVFGLSALNANAEFSGYYAIDNPGPGGRVFLPVGSSGPVAQGNWQLWSETRSIVEFQRAPSDSAALAQGFQLTVKPGGTPANVGSFEILQMPLAYPNPNLLDVYTFTYNFGLPVPGNEAWYIDADGTNKVLSGTGSAVFKAPRGDAGQTWGFYVRTDNGSLPPLSGVLQVQDWQQVPEPSSVAMTLISGLCGLGYVIRGYRLRRENKA